MLMLSLKIIMYETSLAFLKLAFRKQLQKLQGFGPGEAFAYLCEFTDNKKNLYKVGEPKMDCWAITNFLESSLVPKVSTMEFIKAAAKGLKGSAKDINLGINIFKCLKKEEF